MSATASSSLAVSFASKTGSTCSVSGSTVTMLSAGTCTVQATQTGNTDYAAATPVSVNFTINQISQSISFTPASPVTYGVAPITLTATGGASGNPVTFSVLSGPGSITGSVLTVTGAGTIVIAANQASDTDYLAAPQVMTSIQVNQATQSISFTPASPVTYGVAPITLTATGGASGNPVTFSVLSGPGSITGSVLTVTGAGAIVVAANQASNTDYLAASQVMASIQVSQAALSITANNASKIYGTANPTFTGSVTGQQTGDTFTESFMTSATTSSPVNTYSIVPSVTGTNLADYTQLVTDGTLTITKAASTTSLNLSSTSITPLQSVTFTATVASTTTGTPTGTVSFYDNGTLLGSPAAITAGVAQYTAASLAPGITHTIVATYSGDTNFTGSSNISTSIVIVAPLDFTITISGPPFQTVVPGSTVTYQVTVNPDFGSFAGTVSFAVNGLPPGASATISPSSMPANGGPQTITVTIQTAPAMAAARAPSPPAESRMAPFALAFLLLFGAGALRKRGRALRRLLCIAALLLGGAAATSILSGCAGNGFFAQAPQNYSVTITATSGNLQHSATFTVNVQ